MKYVIQVATTDVKDVTAKIRLITAYYPQYSDGSSDYPWFVEGDDPIFTVHQGTVCGVKLSLSAPIDIQLCRKWKDTDLFIIIKIFAMFDWMGLVNSSGSGFVSGYWTQSGNNIEFNWNLIS